MDLMPNLVVIEHVPWPAKPIYDYPHVRSGEWGYLNFYKDGTFVFVYDAPSDAEILKRWRMRLLKNIEKDVFAPMAFNARHIKYPLEVLRDTNNNYFIGAVLPNNKASKESIQDWNTSELAETALLLDEWARVDCFTEIDIK